MTHRREDSPTRFVAQRLALRPCFAVILAVWLAAAAFAGEPPDGLRLVEWQVSRGPLLQGAIDLALGPEGESLYVAGFLDDALTAYRRDSRTGALSVIGAGSDPALDGAVAVALSPDGTSLYAAGLLADRIVGFARDPDTAELTDAAPAPDPAIGGPLDGPSSLAVTPDGTRLVAVGLDDSRIFLFDRAPDGVLSPPVVVNVPALAGARDLALSADGTFVYVADFDGDALLVLERISGSVLLRQVVDGQFELDNPNTLVLAPGGADLYVACLGGSSLLQYRRDATTGLLTLGQIWSGATLGMSVAISDDGRELYTTGLTAGEPGALGVWSRDPATGEVSPEATLPASGVPGTGLDGAAGVVTHGGLIYVAALTGHAVSVLERRPSGTPRHVETQFRDSPQVLHPRSALFAGDAQVVHLIGLHESPCNPCLGYSAHLRDPETGALTAVRSGDLASSPGLTSPEEAAASPDGRHYYVVDGTEDALMAIEVGADGLLTPVETYFDGTGGVDGLEGVLSVAVSPDGAHVYTASFVEDRIARFSRDAASGALTFLGLTPAPVARRLTLSPDGRHLYVAQSTQQVVAFARDPATGALTQIDVESEGVGGVSGLVNPVALAVSRDGRNLYVNDDSAPPRLTVFARDPQTGTLDFLETHAGGAGTAGPLAVAVAAGGGYVYVTGATDATVSVYRRNRTDGTLVYLRTVGDGVFPPLEGAAALTVSPDGRHLYAPAQSDRAITVFETGDLLVSGFESGDLGEWSSSVGSP